MMSERKKDRIIRIHKKNLFTLKKEKKANHFPGAFGGSVCVVSGEVRGLRGGRKATKAQIILHIST